MMFWQQWRRRFEKLFNSRTTKKRRTRARQVSFRPLLEQLEMRQMLAVDLSLVSSSFDENGGTATLIASLSSVATSSVTITLSNTGTASYGGADADYEFDGSISNPLTITILNGESTGSVALTGHNDSVYEEFETIELVISSVTGFHESTTGTNQTVSTLIIDDELPPTVSLSASTTSISENGGVVTIVATLSGLVGQTTTIVLEKTTGTAIENDDYTHSSPLQILIPAGETSGSVTITGKDDSIDEPVETFTGSIITVIPIALLLTNSEFSFTIEDDDASPELNLNISSATFSEVAGTASIQLTLSASSSQVIQVPLTFAGTATEGTDYSASTTSVSFAVGETSKMVTLTGLNDTVFDPGETVLVSISGTPAGTTLGTTTSGSLTVVDDDSAPSVTLLTPSPTSIHESGSTTTLVAQLSHLSNDPVTIQLQFTGTATSGVDYSVSSTSITIAPGASTGSITLVGLTDAAPLFEDTESILIEIVSVSGGSENGSQLQSMSLLDQDAKPTLTLALSETTTAESSTTAITLLATITGPVTAQDIVIPFTLTGTATSGSDYATSPSFGSPASGSIVILANSTSGSVLFSNNTDLIDEGVSESIAINLGTLPSNVNYTGSNTFAITQFDDQATPTLELSINQATIGEDGGEATLIVELSGASSQPAVVNLALSGTATASDYVLSNPTIVVPAGSLTGSISLTALFDHRIEGNETVIVDVTSIDGGVAIEALPQQVSASITDLPVTLSRLGSGDLAESGTETIIASLSQTRAVDTTVSLTLSGDAASGSDYTLTPGMIVIPANALSASIAFSSIDDSTDEVDESVTLAINVPGGTASAAQIVSFNLLDNDNPPTLNLAINNASINEAGGVAIITATLSGPAAQAVTASINVTGSATLNTDYLLSSNTLSFAPGETVATVSITAQGDVVSDPNETVIVSLSNLSASATLGTASTVQTTIVDAALPTVTLSRLGSGSLNENGSDTIVATLSATSAQNVIVTLSTSGTANSGSDYTLTATTISIAAGSLTGSVTLNGSDDTRDDADSESVIIDIASVAPGAAAAENGTQSVTINLIDNDSLPNVTGFSISNTSLSENGGSASIVATIGAVSDRDVTIQLTASGTASSASDYVLSSNSIVIPAGSTSGSITLTATLDAVSEPAETVVLDIANVTNGSENGTRSVQATISNVAIPGVTLTRVGSGDVNESGSTTIIASLSQTSSVAITVNLSATGTAVTGSDYTLGANSIVIPSGTLSASTSLTMIDDLRDELNESVTLSIASIVPTGGAATSSPSSVTFLIADNDSPPDVTLTTSTTSIAESGGSAIITARLSAASNLPVTVNLGFGGTATSGSDYSFSSTSIVIPAGETSGSISITASSDTLNEANETAIVRIDSVSNGTESGIQEQTITINDDDVAPSVSLSLSSTTLSERNQTVTLQAILSVVSGRTITVPVTFAGSATAGVDYLTGSGVITITAGQTAGSLTLTSVNDTTTEGNETIQVALAASSNSSYQLSANSSGTVTLNDDGDGTNVTVQFSQSSQSTTEQGGTRSIVVTLSQARGVVTDVTVTPGGSATLNSDYSLSSTTISIPAGQTSASIAATILTDNIVENNETIVLSLSAPAGTLAGSNTAHTVTIAGHIQQSGSTVVVTGTEGDDTFTTRFDAPDRYTITLRGPGGESISQSFTTSNASVVSFNALGGNDTGIVHGSSASESVVMSAGTMFFGRTVPSATASSAITITTTNTERNEFHGGNTDIARLNGSTASETFTGTPTSSQLAFSSNNQLNLVTGLRTVTVDGAGGTDTANFDDVVSTSNESFIGGATQSQYLRNGTFNIVANNFEKVNAQSRGGTDSATYLGSSSSETFYGLGTRSVLVSGANRISAVNFDTTRVFAGTGGTDQAVFGGTSGNDTLTGSYSQVNFVGVGYSYEVNGYDRYYAFGGGGTDTADLDDGTGDDKFYGIQNGVYLVGETPATATIFAGRFSSVTVTSTNGTDQALLYDSAGNDTFVGSDSLSTLSGTGYAFAVANFANVIVFCGAGVDAMTLTDTTGDDHLAGAGENLIFSGAGYSIQMLNAESVSINQTRGGNDTANLSDSLGSDAVFAIGGRFQLRTIRTLIRLFGFDAVTARSSLGGFDTKTVGATDYVLTLTGNWLPF